MDRPKEEVSDETRLYCTCRGSYDGQEFMIECNKCNEWFHGNCVGIKELEAFDIETYHCPSCADEFGPLVLKRRRNFHRHDYSEIDSGSKAIQSGTLAFILELRKKKVFLKADTVVKRMKGDELTLDYLNKNGLVQPILVEEKEGLDIVVPDTTFTIMDVEKHVGSMRDLDVIDVSKQEDFKMKMRHWTEYYDSRPRQNVLNVISLEFSDTKLNSLVHPPAVVTAVDWINLYWPQQLHESGDKKPQVQKYCLMSVENSYTDFHVDFGGTSVWYHVLKGEKIFYLIPPSPENLLMYEEWVSSSSQSEVFFGDLVEHCYQFNITAGNTFFIPSGWIHAVFTPADSLVFGGNFLNDYCIKQQLGIYNLEMRLKTPEKFVHPKYEALVWFAAKELQEQFEKCLSGKPVANESILASAKSLYTSLSAWSKDRKRSKEIPESVDEVHLLSVLDKCATLAKDKYGSEVDLGSSLSQWQRTPTSSSSVGTMKLKLKRDTSVILSEVPKKSRGPKISRKRPKESVAHLEEEEEEEKVDGDHVVGAVSDHADKDFVYLDLYDELNNEEESDDVNWVPGGSGRSSSSGKRPARKAVEVTAKSPKPKLAKSTSDPPYQEPKEASGLIKHKGPSKSKLMSSKQRLGKILGIKGSFQPFQSKKK